MGLAAPELPVESYSSTGSLNFYNSPPAIHLVLSQEELRQTYGLYQASGGTVTSILINSPAGSKTQIEKAPQSQLANAIQEICSTFGLTKEELTQVCNIQSRKTLYNWINGEVNPRKSAMNRIFRLLTTARAWKHAGLSNSAEFLHKPILDGKSVLNLLTEPEIDKESILFAGSRLSITSPQANPIADPFA